MKRLAELPSLELLRIGSPRLTNTSLQHVATMSRLRFLHLINVPITDPGLENLSGFGQLESLYLDGSQVTEDGITGLMQQLPELHLHLNQRHPDNHPADHTH